MSFKWAELIHMYVDGRLEGYPWRGHAVGRGSFLYFITAPFSLLASPLLLWAGARAGEVITTTSAAVLLLAGAVGTVKALGELQRLPHPSHLEGIKALLREMERALEESTAAPQPLGVERQVGGLIVRDEPYPLEGPYALIAYREARGELWPVVKMPYLFAGEDVVFLTFQGVRGEEKWVRKFMRRIKKSILNPLAEHYRVWMLEPSHNAYMHESTAGALPFGVYHNLFAEMEGREMWVRGYLTPDDLLKRATGLTRIGEAEEMLTKGRAFFANKKALGRFIVRKRNGERKAFIRITAAPLKAKKVVSYAQLP